MPWRAKISILGLYHAEPTLFEDLQLPTYTDDENVSHDYISKDALVNNLLMELAELEVIYPDPEFMKEAIAMWSASRLPVWKRVALVLFEDYDPFVNIKRHEDRTITQTRDLAGSSSSQYNVNAWDDQSENGVQTNTASGSSTDTGTVTTHEVFDVAGDSAITDAQDVARNEIELRSAYNLIDYIINDFKKRFCLMVY